MTHRTMSNEMFNEQESTLNPEERFALPVMENLDSVFADRDRFETAEQRRAQRLLLHEVEFISSPLFQEDHAAEVILVAPEEPPNGGRRKLLKAPSGTPPYLAALYAIPLLTREQEHYLFRKMNYLKFLAENLRRRIDPAAPRTGLLDQMEALLAEALCVRNQIIKANLRLVVSIAKKLVDEANSFDDLVAEGNVPLIRAVEIFDFDRGTRFSTYATWAIRNSLLRVKPRNQNRLKRYLTSRETLFAGATETRGSRLSEERFHLNVREILEEMLPHLTIREQQIVKARFGIDTDEPPKKFREIADDLGISTERVRQLLLRSMTQLKEYAEENNLELPELDE
jgi:RNA polymerase primary sigma factor